jgi:hypothetical protein
MNSKIKDELFGWLLLLLCYCCVLLGFYINKQVNFTYDKRDEIVNNVNITYVITPVINTCEQINKCKFEICNLQSLNICCQDNFTVCIFGIPTVLVFMNVSDTIFRLECVSYNNTCLEFYSNTVNSNEVEVYYPISDFNMITLDRNAYKHANNTYNSISSLLSAVFILLCLAMFMFIISLLEKRFVRGEYTCIDYAINKCKGLEQVPIDDVQLQ